MKTKVLLAMAIPGLCLLAADKIQPINAKTGVWEVTTTRQMSGGPTASTPSIPADKLAQLPPAQRAQIEAMIKQRSGMGGPVTKTMQTCVTQDKLDKAPFSEDRPNCKRTIVNSTSKLLEFHEVCTDDDGSQTTADAKYEVTGDNSMKGNVKGTSNHAGHAITMNIDLTGKWVSADCSAIKK
jgi:hypothetical protein